MMDHPRHHWTLKTPRQIPCSPILQLLLLFRLLPCQRPNYNGGWACIRDPSRLAFFGENDRGFNSWGTRVRFQSKASIYLVYGTFFGLTGCARLLFLYVFGLHSEYGGLDEEVRTKTTHRSAASSCWLAAAATATYVPVYLPSDTCCGSFVLFCRGFFFL